ncbi:hypothetical protein J7438_00180 [Thalassotalea sp. G20_0]|uniref:hypothetical protein n=1 Tax=Thalassotalea sp. G20_0 TaxID=2821093 RepID=UPI001ADCC5C2|nr:hypothetical protein [Thalassotalea sp. G20_0]MBO9492517.1 hypothetical protein [Thalassotalea sp. G20_0]
MYRPTIFAQLNAASGHLSCFQDTPFSKSHASGVAFSRDIIDAAVILCAMRADETTKKYLQQSTVPFHNPVDDTRLGKRSIASVNNKEDQLFYSPVRTESLNNDHAHTYIPENQRFLIQPATDTGQSTPQISSVVNNNQNDPDYAERKKEHRRARRRERYQNDPVYAERERERWRMLRKDPVYAKRIRERARERERERYQNDPDYVERKKERQRALRRERYRNDPAYAARERARIRGLQRKRYQNDPAYAERRRELIRRQRRERYQNNTVYAERERDAKGSVTKTHNKQAATFKS